MSRLRVLYLVKDFPQLSQTYILSEVAALRNDCDIKIVSLTPKADTPVRQHPPYHSTSDPDEIKSLIVEFKPHVLHSHWLIQARALAYFAGLFDDGFLPRTPFTIRSHSFDVLANGGQHIVDAAPFVNSELCLGILAFPFARPLLEDAGIRGQKIHDCFPSVDVGRFLDRSPNGEAVMNVGACLPKKKMEDFLQIAAGVPSMDFNLYAIGYLSGQILEKNEDLDRPVNVISPVQPEQMPAEYKKHRWLVYTADRQLGTVGWPMAVAEAQASGVGVCIPRIASGLDEYVGAAGFLYDSIDEVKDIITRPFPDRLRDAGFELAQRSDIAKHKSILLELWRRTLEQPTRLAAPWIDNSVPPWGDGPTILEHHHRIKRAIAKIECVVPEESSFILAGNSNQWMGHSVGSGRLAIPFIEKQGVYWGEPQDDEEAIQAFEDMRADRKVRYFVVSWLNFWWSDHYPIFCKYLADRHQLIASDELVWIFDVSHDGMSPGVQHAPREEKWR